VDIKYTNNFNCKTLQSLPKFGFLVLKYTIWQPRFRIGQKINEGGGSVLSPGFAAWIKPNEAPGPGSKNKGVEA
jgi:hypothetical protein